MRAACGFSVVRHMHSASCRSLYIVKCYTVKTSEEPNNLQWCFTVGYNALLPPFRPSPLHCVNTLPGPRAVGSLQGCSWCSWAVEVHVEPFSVAAMPHTSLLRLAGARPSLAVNVLRQANVGDAGGVFTDQMDMWVENGGVHWFAVFTENCWDGNGQISYKR